MDHESRKGVFACAGCDQAAYRSEDKFDSGTGWPSFTRPIEGAVGESVDRSWFGTRDGGALLELRRAFGPRVP